MKAFHYLKGNLNKLTTSLSRSTVILAFQLQDLIDTIDINLDLVSFNVRRAIRAITSKELRSPEISKAQIVNTLIDRIRATDSLESKHISRWVVNHSQLRKNVRTFQSFIKALLEESFSESIDISPIHNSVRHSSSIDDSLEASRTRRHHRLTSEKESINHNLFESPNNSSRSSTKVEASSRRPSSTSDTSAEKNIYHRSLDLDSRFITPTSNMSKQIDAHTQRIIDAVIDNYVARHPASQSPSDPQESSGSQGVLDADNDHDTSAWRSEDLDFFDPHLPVTSKYGSESMVRDGKDVYYRNVHLFIERILNLAVTKDHDVVKTNLNTCLQDIALIWYIDELTALKRFELRQIDLTKKWINSLKKRFKLNQFVAISSLIAEKFFIADVRNDRESFSYVQQIVNYAKDASFDTIYHQLIWAWRNLDPKLKRDIDAPIETTTLTQFLEKVEVKKKIWQDVYRSRSNQSSQRDRDDRGRVGDRTDQYSNNLLVNQNAGNRFVRKFLNRQFQRQNNYNPNYANSYQYYPSYNQQAYRSQYSQPENPPSNTQGLTAPASQRLLDESAQPTPEQQDNQSDNQQDYQQDEYDSKSAADNRSLNQPDGRYPLQSRNNWQSNRPARAYQEDAYVADSPDNDENAVWKNVSKDFPFEYHGHEKQPRKSAWNILSATDHTKSNHDYVDVDFVDTPRQLKYTCRLCQQTFYSNNKLHKHVRDCRKTFSNSKPAVKHVSTDKQTHDTTVTDKNAQLSLWKQSVIVFTATSNKNDEYEFRNWKYATVKTTIAYQKAMKDLCLNIDCTMSLIDRQWLHVLISDIVIKQTVDSMTIREIEDREHFSSDYASVDLYLKSKLKGKTFIAHIKRDVHVVDNLRAKMLIGTNIMCPEGMIANLQTRKLIIDSCNMTTPIICTLIDFRINRIVRSHHVVTISAHIVVTVSFKQDVDLSVERDYSFQPHVTSINFGAKDDIMTHIVDFKTSMIHVRNVIDKAITVSKHTKLDKISDFDEENCYHVDVADIHLVVGVSWKRRALTAIVDLVMVATPLLSDLTISSTTTSIPISTFAVLQVYVVASASSLEITISSNITVYGTSPIVQQRLQSIAKAFLSIWKDSGGTVNVFEKDWMSIKTIPDIKPESPRVYPVGSQDREFIDQEFNKLQRKEKMNWTRDATSYGFSVFVVWKTVHASSKNSVKKNRVVIDIRDLNKMSESNDYPMSLQSDIISSVSGCPYVNVMNAAGFFHQWLIKIADRHKLTVVSHKDSEQFNVTIMRFRNSPTYVQRQINTILRDFRDFARAYVNDIVVFSKTLEKHIEHLIKIFELFRKMNIVLKFSKIYLEYPTVALLDQKIDSFELIIVEKKLKVISKLRFLATLKQLETYLSLIEWMRDYVSYYAQLSNSLQIRKTLMLKDSSIKSNARKRFSSDSRLDISIDSETKSYEIIQKVFFKLTFLVHHDRTRQLYADVDASHERDFEATVYHVKNDKKIFTKENIQSISFLSKILTPTEIKYWLIELETTDLVWLVKRIRHMIDVVVAISQIIIYTDHSIITSIVKQIKLFSNSIDKLNLRLVRASTYLSQFRLDVQHKLEKQHIVSDVLSRLPFNADIVKRVFDSDQSKDTLDMTYHVILMKMSDDFKIRLKETYLKNKRWIRILELIKPKDTVVSFAVAEPPTEESTEKLFSSSEDLRFRYRDELIYYVSELDDDRERLCIPKQLVGEIFALAHDRLEHADFHKTYDRIVTSFFIKKLTRKLQTYVAHCSQCQIHRTVKHFSYDSLRLIQSLSILFHTMTMDFILALSVTIVDEYDVMLTVICKFIKRVLLMSDKSTWIAEQWINAFLLAVLSHDWSVPRAIISDRDKKFMSVFWTDVFKRLNIDLLISIAYHSQIDEQSERINQTIEIALRYWIVSNSNVDFIENASYIQIDINNIVVAEIGYILNELCYEFRLQDNLDLLSDMPTENWSAFRLQYRKDAEEVIAWANMIVKFSYDRRHTSLNLKENSLVYLRLHHEYIISDIKSKKLSQQRIDFFKILQKMSTLAYRLELSPVMTIHSVVSVAMLESVPIGEDSYHRSRPDQKHSSSVTMKHDDDPTSHYEIERLLNKRIFRGKIQYLVKWRDYESADNVWYNIDDLTNAQDLIDDYEENVARRSDLAQRARRRPTARRQNWQNVAVVIPPARKLTEGNWENQTERSESTAFLLVDDRCYECMLLQ